MIFAPTGQTVLPVQSEARDHLQGAVAQELQEHFRPRHPARPAETRPGRTQDFGHRTWK